MLRLQETQQYNCEGVAESRRAPWGARLCAGGPPQAQRPVVLYELPQALSLAFEQFLEQVQLVPGADYYLTHLPLSYATRAEHSSRLRRKRLVDRFVSLSPGYAIDWLSPRFRDPRDGGGGPIRPAKGSVGWPLAATGFRL